MADIGPKARREAAHGAKADKPKRYDPPNRLQDWGQTVEFLASGQRMPTRPHLHARWVARMLARRSLST